MRDISHILGRLAGLTQTREGQWKACCPNHLAHTNGDRSKSFSIGIHGDKVVMQCFANKCSTEDLCASLGIEMKDLFLDTPQKTKPTVRAYDSIRSAADSVETNLKREKQNDGIAVTEATQTLHRYTDRVGNDLITVVRIDYQYRDGASTKKDKTMRPFAFIDGKWYGSLDSFPLRPLYNLPAVISSPSVVVTEGEKAADALNKIGIIATCSLGGSKSGKQTDWTALAGKHVTIWRDNDDPGLKYSNEIAAIIKAESLRFVVTGIDGSKDDAYDFIKGFSDPALARQSIFELIASAPVKTRTEIISGTFPDPIPLKFLDYATDKFCELPCPPKIKRYISKKAKMVGVPEDFVGVFMIVAIGSLLSHRAMPTISDGYSDRTKLWGFLVAPPGTGKTPAMEDILNTLESIENRWIEKNREAEARHEINQEINQSKMKGLLERAKKERHNDDIIKELTQLKVDTEKNIFKRVRCIVRDATVEKMQQIMEEVSNCPIWFRDEIISILRRADSGSGGDNRQSLLESYSNKGYTTIERVYKQDKKPRRSSANFSIFGSMQPDVASEFVSSEVSKNDGMLLRFLAVCWPASEDFEAASKSQEFGLSDADERKEIFDLFMQVFEGDIGVTKAIGEEVPGLPFDKEAAEIFGNWSSWNKDRYTGEKNNLLQNYYSKLSSFLIKLSAIAQMCMTGKAPVTEVAMKIGVRWMEYFESHALKLYLQKTNRHYRKSLELANRIVTDRVETFRISDLQERLIPEVDNKEDHFNILRILIEMNWIRRESDKVGDSKITKYVVNPKVFAGESIIVSKQENIQQRFSEIKKWDFEEMRMWHRKVMVQVGDVEVNSDFANWCDDDAISQVHDEIVFDGNGGEIAESPSEDPESDIPFDFDDRGGWGAL